jgi:hypothetical protein
LSVEYNNVTVGALVHMGVAPDVPDVSKAVLSCPESAVEHSRATCTLWMYDAQNNPANTRICPSDDPIVGSVTNQDTGEVATSVVVDIQYRGSNCCDDRAIGDETEGNSGGDSVGGSAGDSGCFIEAAFDLPASAGNGTSLLFSVGLASKFKERSTSSVLAVTGDPYIFGNNPDASNGGRRRLENTAMEVLFSNNGYSVGDSVVFKTIVTLAPYPNYDSISTFKQQEYLTDLRAFVGEELNNFVATASNAGIPRSVTTTLAAGGGPNLFEFTHMFQPRSKGKTTFGVTYRGDELTSQWRTTGFDVRSLELDSTASNIVCPFDVVVGESFECRVRLFDIYGNTVDHALLDLSLNTFTATQTGKDGTNSLDVYGAGSWSDTGEHIMIIFNKALSYIVRAHPP